MKQWITQIDKTTQNFADTFGGLSVEQMNWKPNAATWSIAQNMEHLIVINKSYFPVIDAVRKGTYKTPFTAKLVFLVSFFGKTVLKAVMILWSPTNNGILISPWKFIS